MERNRISKVALVIAVVMIMCMPLTAFASEKDMHINTRLL